MGINFSGLSAKTMTLPDNAFQGGVHITDKKSAGNDGGAFSGGAWRTRDLNTNEFSWGNVGNVVVGSNTVTPTAGWWLLIWSAPAIRVNDHVSRVYTSWGGIKAGTTEHADSAGYENPSRSVGCARFSFNGSQYFQIQHYASTGQSNNYGYGMGISNNDGRFTEVICLKFIYDS